ncbi:hypothetical protein K1T71_008661 [Dendrolimus kikuchii]|uniref:Uncharacterized protein n=1 Tax=Dendrolimus kikuchii TaxID=765133 RepID=A0ACC1CV98_9NEOP|nr:hypothetical protein K1T71_008661 [Dendrolimus kikuchii]
MSKREWQFEVPGYDNNNHLMETRQRGLQVHRNTINITSRDLIDKICSEIRYSQLRHNGGVLRDTNMVRVTKCRSEQLITNGTSLD